MKLKTFYANMSIKYKILISVYGIVILISLILGYYAFYLSKNSLLEKVSSANLGMIKQVDNNIDFLLREAEYISYQLSLDTLIQTSLKNQNTYIGTQKEDIYIDNSLRLTLNLIAAKEYISLIILYSNSEAAFPFHRSSLGGLELSTITEIKKSDIYKSIYQLKGKPAWFILDREDQTFIKNHVYQKIILARIIRDYQRYNNIGVLIFGINASKIQKMYLDNLKENNGSIVIVDKDGRVVSEGGPRFYTPQNNNAQFIKQAAMKKEGFTEDTIDGKKMLIAYSNKNIAGWTLYYAVPMETLTQEVSASMIFTMMVIVGCLLLSFPVLLAVSSFLTAPIKKLLKSMKKFQEGNFDESVEFKYKDEIGQLGLGYNNMVSNIKELVNTAYVLQIKEREAELNALQAQINPHFLYNTLDIIFWKAKALKENEISEIVYSLSMLFRLSLNRGKGFTLVSNEKQLIEHYLILQKVRFKNKLNYSIGIDFDILHYVIPKLILQPFVENAILHGLEKKKIGGTVNILGSKYKDKLRFLIQDDGIGMDEAAINNLLNPEIDSPVNASFNTGGYAVKNVDERLHLIFGDKYTLNFTSTPNTGTTVEILIPADPYNKGED